MSLAVAGVVVRATTLVACSGTVGRHATKAATEATSESGTTTAGTASGRSAEAWSWAVPGNVAHLTAGIAATASGASGDAQSRAVGLDVTKTLAMVALLGCAHC